MQNPFIKWFSKEIIKSKNEKNCSNVITPKTTPQNNHNIDTSFEKGFVDHETLDGASISKNEVFNMNPMKVTGQNDEQLFFSLELSASLLSDAIQSLSPRLVTNNSNNSLETHSTQHDTLSETSLDTAAEVAFDDAFMKMEKLCSERQSGYFGCSNSSNNDRFWNLSKENEEIIKSQNSLKIENEELKKKIKFLEYFNDLGQEKCQLLQKVLQNSVPTQHTLETKLTQWNYPNVEHCETEDSKSHFVNKENIDLGTKTLENTMARDLLESLEAADLNLQNNKEINLDLMASLQHLKQVILNDGVTTLQDASKLFTNVFSMYEQSKKKLKETNERLQEICEAHDKCQKELALKNSLLYESQRRACVLQKILKRRIFHKNCLSSSHTCCAKYTKLDQQVRKHTRKKKGFQNIKRLFSRKNRIRKNIRQNSKKINVKTKSVYFSLNSNQSYMNHQQDTLGREKRMRIFSLPEHSVLYSLLPVLKECQRYQRYPSIFPSVIFSRYCQKKRFLSRQQLYNFFNHCILSYEKSPYCFTMFPVIIGVQAYKKNIFFNICNIFQFYFRKTHFNQWRELRKYQHPLIVSHTALLKKKGRNCKTVTSYPLSNGRSNPIFAENKHSIISYFFNKTTSRKFYIRYTIFLYTLMYVISTLFQGAYRRDLKRLSLHQSFLHSTLRPLKHLRQNCSLFLYFALYLIKKTFFFSLLCYKSGFKKYGYMNRSKVLHSYFCTYKAKRCYTQRNHHRKAFYSVSFCPWLSNQNWCNVLVKPFINNNTQWNWCVHSRRTTNLLKVLRQKNFLVHCGGIHNVNGNGFSTVTEFNRVLDNIQQVIFFVLPQQTCCGTLIQLYLPFIVKETGVCNQSFRVPTTETFRTPPNKHTKFSSPWLHTISLMAKSFFHNKSSCGYNQFFQRFFFEPAFKFDASYPQRSRFKKIQTVKVTLNSNLQELLNSSECFEINNVAVLDMDAVNNVINASRKSNLLCVFLCFPSQSLMKCLHENETMLYGLGKKPGLVSLSLLDNSFHATQLVELKGINPSLLSVSRNNTAVRYSKDIPFQMLTSMVCCDATIQKKSWFQLPQLKYQCQFIENLLQWWILQSHKNCFLYCNFFAFFNMYREGSFDNSKLFFSTRLLSVLLNFLCNFDGTFVYLSPNFCSLGPGIKQFLKRLDHQATKHQILTSLFIQNSFESINFHVSLNLLLEIVQCIKLQLNSEENKICLQTVNDDYSPRNRIATSSQDNNNNNNNNNASLNNLLVYVLSIYSSMTLKIHIPTSQSCYVPQLPSTLPFVKHVCVDNQQIVSNPFNTIQDFSDIFQFKTFMKLVSKKLKNKVSIKFFHHKPSLRNIVYFSFSTNYNFLCGCLLVLLPTDIKKRDQLWMENTFLLCNVKKSLKLPVIFGLIMNSSGKLYKPSCSKPRCASLDFERLFEKNTERHHKLRTVFTKKLTKIIEAFFQSSNCQSKRVKVLKHVSDNIVTCICEQMPRYRKTYPMNKFLRGRVMIIIVPHVEVKLWIWKNCIFSYRNVLTYCARRKKRPSFYPLKKNFYFYFLVNKTYRRISDIFLLPTHVYHHVNFANRFLRFYVFWSDKHIYKNTLVSKRSLSVSYAQLFATFQDMLRNSHFICLEHSKSQKLLFFVVHKFNTSLFQKQAYISTSYSSFVLFKKDALRWSIKCYGKHTDMVLGLPIKKRSFLKTTKSYTPRIFCRRWMVIDVHNNFVSTFFPKSISHVVYYLVPKFANRIRFCFSMLISRRTKFIRTFKKSYNLTINSYRSLYTLVLSTIQNQSCVFFKKTNLFLVSKHSVFFIQSTVYPKEDIKIVREQKFNTLGRRLKLLNVNHKCAQLKKNFGHIKLLGLLFEKLIHSDTSSPVAKLWRVMQHCWRIEHEPLCRRMFASVLPLVFSQDYWTVIIERKNFQHNGNILLSSQSPSLKFSFQKNQMAAQKNLNYTRSSLAYQSIFFFNDDFKMCLTTPLKESEVFRLPLPFSNVSILSVEKIYELLNTKLKCVFDHQVICCEKALNLCIGCITFINVLQDVVEGNVFEFLILNKCNQQTKMKFFYIRKGDKIDLKNIIEGCYHYTFSKMRNRNDFSLTTTAKDIEKKSNFDQAFVSEFQRTKSCHSVQLCQIQHNTLKILTRMLIVFFELFRHGTSNFSRWLLYGNMERLAYNEVGSSYLTSIHNLHEFFRKDDNKRELIENILIHICSLLHLIFYKSDLSQIYNIKSTEHLLKLQLAKIFWFVSFMFDVVAEETNEKMLKQVFCFNKNFYHLYKSVIQLAKNRSDCPVDIKEIVLRRYKSTTSKGHVQQFLLPEFWSNQINEVILGVAAVKTHSGLSHKIFWVLTQLVYRYLFCLWYQKTCRIIIEGFADASTANWSILSQEGSFVVPQVNGVVMKSGARNKINLAFSHCFFSSNMPKDTVVLFKTALELKGPKHFNNYSLNDNNIDEISRSLFKKLYKINYTTKNPFSLKKFPKHKNHHLDNKFDTLKQYKAICDVLSFSSNVFQQNVLMEIEWNKIQSCVSNRTMYDAPQLHNSLMLVFLTAKIFSLEPSLRNAITHLLKNYSIIFHILESFKKYGKNVNTLYPVFVLKKKVFKEGRHQFLKRRTHFFYTWSNTFFKKNSKKKIVRRKIFSLKVKRFLFSREKKISNINALLSGSCQYRDFISQCPVVLPSEPQCHVIINNVSSFSDLTKQKKDKEQIDYYSKQCCGKTTKINFLTTDPHFEREKETIAACDKEKTICYKLYETLLLEKEELQKRLETEKTRHEQLYIKNLNAEEKLINEIKKCQQLSAEKKHLSNQLRFVKAVFDTKKEKFMTLTPPIGRTEQKLDTSKTGYCDVENHEEGAKKKSIDFKNPIELPNKKVFNVKKETTFCSENDQRFLVKKEKIKKNFETERECYKKIWKNYVDKKSNHTVVKKTCDQRVGEKENSINPLVFFTAQHNRKNENCVILTHSANFTEQENIGTQIRVNDTEANDERLEKQELNFKKAIDPPAKKVFDVKKKGAFCIESYQKLLVQKDKYEKRLENERLRYEKIWLSNIDIKENLRAERKKCEQVYEDKQKCLNQLFFTEKELEKQRTQFSTLINQSRLLEQGFNRAQMAYHDNVLYHEDFKNNLLLSIKSNLVENKKAFPIQKIETDCLNLYGALLCEQETQEKRLQKKIICHEEIQVQNINDEENHKIKHCGQLALALTECKNHLCSAERQLDNQTMKLKALTHKSRLMEQELKITQIRRNDEVERENVIENDLHTLTETIEVATVNASILNRERNLLFESYKRLLVVKNKQEKLLESERIRYEKVWLKLLSMEKILWGEKKKCDQLAADKIDCFHQLSLAKTELHTQRMQFVTIKKQKNLIEQEYNRAQMQCHDKNFRDVVLDNKLRSLTKDIKRSNEMVCALQKEKTFYCESYQKLLVEREEIEKRLKREGFFHKELLLKHKSVEETLKDEKKMCQKFATENITFLKQLRYAEAELKNQRAQFCKLTDQRKKIELEFNRAQMYFNDKEVFSESLKEESLTLKKAIEVANNNISVLQKEKALCVESYEALRIEKENVVNSLKGKKIAYMKVRFEKLLAKKTLETFKLRCQHLEHKICKYIKQICAMKTIFREKTTKFNDLKKKTVILETELNSLQSSCSNKEIFNKSLENTLVTLQKAFDVTSKKLFTLQMENILHFKSRQTLLVEKSQQTDLLKREKIRYEELQHENKIAQKQLQNEKKSCEKLASEKDECLNQLCVAETELRKHRAEFHALTKQTGLIERELNIIQMRYQDKNFRSDMLEIKMETLRNALESATEKMFVFRKGSALRLKSYQILLSENVKQRRLLRCQKIRYKKLQLINRNVEKKLKIKKKSAKQLAFEKNECVNELHAAKEEFSKHRAESNDLAQRTNLIEQELNRAQMRYHDKDCRNDILEMEMKTLRESLESANDKMCDLRKRNTLRCESHQALLTDKTKLEKLLEREKMRSRKLQLEKNNAKIELQKQKKTCRQLLSKKNSCLKQLCVAQTQLSKRRVDFDALIQKTNLVECELNRTHMRYHDMDCRNDILEIEAHTLRKALKSVNENMSILRKKSTLNFISYQALLIKKVKQQKVLECEKIRCIKLQHVYKNAEKKLQNTKKSCKQLGFEKNYCLNELYATKNELNNHRAETNDLTKRTSLIERELNRAQMRYHDKDCRNDILEIEVHTLRKALKSVNENMSVLREKSTLNFISYQALLIEKVKQQKVLECEKIRYIKLQHVCKNTERKLRSTKKSCKQLASGKSDCFNQLCGKEEELCRQRVEFYALTQQTSRIERELNRAQMRYYDKDCCNDILEIELQTLREALESANQKMCVLQKRNSLNFESHQALLIDKIKQEKILEREKMRFRKLQLKKNNTETELQNQKKISRQLAYERDNCLKQMCVAETQLSKERLNFNAFIEKTSLVERELHRAQMCYSDSEVHNDTRVKELLTLKNVIVAANADINELQKEKAVALELYQALHVQKENLVDILKSKTALYIKVRLEKLLAKKTLENMKKRCQLLERKSCMYKKHIDDIETELSRQNVLLKTTIKHTSFIETELNRVQMEYNDNRSTNKFAKMESTVFKNATQAAIKKTSLLEQDESVCYKSSQALLIKSDRNESNINNQNIMLEKGLPECINMAGHIKDDIVGACDFYKLEEDEKSQTFKNAIKVNNDNIQKAKKNKLYSSLYEQNVVSQFCNSGRRYLLETESVCKSSKKVSLDEGNHVESNSALIAKMKELLKQEDINKATIKSLQQLRDDEKDLTNAIKLQCNRFENEILNEREHSEKLKGEIIFLNQKNEVIQKNLDTALLEKEKLQNVYQRVLASLEQLRFKEENQNALGKELTKLKNQNDLQLYNNTNTISNISELKSNTKRKEVNLGESERELCRVKSLLETAESELVKQRQLMQERNNSYEDLYERFILTKKSMEDAVERAVDIDREYITLKKLYQDTVAKKEHTETCYTLESQRNEKLIQDILKHKKQIEFLDNALIKSQEDFNIFKLENSNLKNSLEKSEKSCESFEKKSQSLECQIKEIKCLLKNSEIRVESLETELNKKLQLLRDMEIKLENLGESINIKDEDTNEMTDSHHYLPAKSQNVTETPCLNVVLLQKRSCHVVVRCERLSRTIKWGRSHGVITHVLPSTSVSRTLCVKIMQNVFPNNGMVERGNTKVSIMLYNEARLLKTSVFSNNVIPSEAKRSMANSLHSAYFNPASTVLINDIRLNERNLMMTVQNFALTNSNDYNSEVQASSIGCYAKEENKHKFSCVNGAVFKNAASLSVDAQYQKPTLKLPGFFETKNCMMNTQFWTQVNASESGTYNNAVKNVGGNQHHYQNIYDQVEEHIEVVTDQLKKIEKKLNQLLVFRSQISKRTHASLHWYTKTNNIKNELLTEYLKNEANFAELLRVEYDITSENVDENSVERKPYSRSQNFLTQTFACKAIENIFKTLFRIQQHIELFTNGCSSFLLGVDLLNDYFEKYLNSKSRDSFETQISNTAVNESRREGNISFTSYTSDQKNYLLMYPVNGSFNSSTEADNDSYALNDIRQSRQVLPQHSSDLSYTCSKMSSNQSHTPTNDSIERSDILPSSVTMSSSEVEPNSFENVCTQDVEYDKVEWFSNFLFKDLSDFVADAEKTQYKDSQNIETIPLKILNSNSCNLKCQRDNVFNEEKIPKLDLCRRNSIFNTCETNSYKTIGKKRHRYSNDNDFMTYIPDRRILPCNNFVLDKKTIPLSLPQDISKDTLLSKCLTEKLNIQQIQPRNDQKFTVTKKCIIILPTTQDTLRHEDNNYQYCLPMCVQQLEDYLSKVLPHLNFKSLASDVYEGDFYYINIILKLYFLYQYDKKKVLHLIESVPSGTTMSQKFLSQVTEFFTQERDHQLALKWQLNNLKKENQSLLKKNELSQNDYNILKIAVTATAKEIELATVSVQKQLNHMEIHDNTASILLKKFQKFFFVIYECVMHKSLNNSEKHKTTMTFSEWNDKLQSWTHEILQEIIKVDTKRTQLGNAPYGLNKCSMTECIYINKATTQAFLSKPKDASKSFSSKETPHKCLSIAKQRHKALIIAPSYQDIFMSYSYLFLNDYNNSHSKPFNYFKGPFNDAMRWRCVLRSMGWKDDQMKFLCEKKKYSAFNSATQPHTLHCRVPTKEAILSGLHWLTSTVQPGYQILLILCGCGALIPNTRNSSLQAIPLKQFLASKETLYDPCFLPSDAFSLISETNTKVTKCETTNSNYSHIVCCGHTPTQNTLKCPKILSVSGIPTQSILSYFNKVPAQADVTLLWDFEITGSSFQSLPPTRIQNSNIKLNFLSTSPSKPSTTTCIPRCMDIRDTLKRALQLFPNMKIFLDTKSPFSIETMIFEKRINLCYESLKPLACNLYFLAASNGQTLAHETNINGVFHGVFSWALCQLLKEAYYRLTCKDIVRLLTQKIKSLHLTSLNGQNEVQQVPEFLTLPDTLFSDAVVPF